MVSGMGDAMTHETDRQPEGIRKPWKDCKRRDRVGNASFRLPTGHLLRVWLEDKVVCIEFSEQKREAK